MILLWRSVNRDFIVCERIFRNGIVNLFCGSLRALWLCSSLEANALCFYFVCLGIDGLC